MSGSALGPVRRPVGLETEYGVLGQPGAGGGPNSPGIPSAPANPMVMASQIVQAYAVRSRAGLVGPDGRSAPAVRWDYEGEDPLADMRGGRLDRADADPSQLTDDPERPAPSAAPPWGDRPRPSAEEANLPRATTAVLPNGARLYVDHAHPEYSSPEVLTPRDALVWDRAGEVIARRAMAAHLRDLPGQEIVLYKNNVDGKGASYGSHENYLVERSVPFASLAAGLTPFLVTRPVMVGAGRVGLGQRSQEPGFQISQRADYIESAIGLQTTFNRPIINTRDEPHADAGRFRRLHVINGDANRFDVPIYLKVASTSLMLWLLEHSHRLGRGLGALEGLELCGDAVEECWAVSHDTALTHHLATRSGPMTALEIQRACLAAVEEVVRQGCGGADGAGGVAEHAADQADAALSVWRQCLDALEQWAARRSGPAPALVEWVAKLELCEAMRARSGTGWDDPRLAALDIQWADLREGRSVVDKLDAAGRIHRLVNPDEVEAAADTPPRGTRAAVRGAAVAHQPAVVAASWTSLVLDPPGRPSLLRLELPGAVALSDDETAAMIEAIGRAAQPGGDLPPQD
ncbi:proteasome accessory factor PafA2 family protein [Actinomyces capricornis]|uniref:Proteasome accessory factor PafA2 n=1 Tax=Actinomyces capricornis TaxID=2755559 RepID=A0ABM7UQ18_9ACTO|nr:proteasome accessory factor PafA2 family protein [Actinomyces capricornis]BDA65445.1 proteasome accessory factor PafA2 [Actinomyces capricornis]